MFKGFCIIQQDEDSVLHFYSTAKQIIPKPVKICQTEF